MNFKDIRPVGQHITTAGENDVLPLDAMRNLDQFVDAIIPGRRRRLETNFLSTDQMLNGMPVEEVLKGNHFKGSK